MDRVKATRDAIGSADREEVRAFAHDVATWNDGEARVAPMATPRLQRLLRADQAAMYRVAVGPGGAELEFGVYTGFRDPDSIPDDTRAMLGQTPTGFATYDPVRPEPDQRNVVLCPVRSIDREKYAALPIVRHVLAHQGLAAEDQVRVLLCDGPALLAWVGCFRREPFTKREEILLALVAPALRRRLTMEGRLLGAELSLAALLATLDRVPGAVFVLGPTGRVVHASETGRALLESRGESLREELRLAIRAEGTKNGGAEIAPLSLRGAPAHFLAVYHAPAPEREDRKRRAERTWRLSPRQAEVLGWILAGDATKMIAGKLGCSIRTVEVHITHLFRKAGVGSRSELLARYWNGI